MNELTTPRLLLHPLSPLEAEQVLAREPNADTRHWAPGYPTEGELNAARHLLRVCEDSGDPRPFSAFEIRRREDGQAIGSVGFHGPPDVNGSVTIGYGLVPSVRGRGYASEALRALLLLARDLGVARVRGSADRDNTASQHVMRAVGMRRAGEDAHLVHFCIALTGMSNRGDRDS